jgi:hypothetical protein
MHKWIEFTFDLWEGELTLNCLCEVSAAYEYLDDFGHDGYEVTVKIIRTTIGNLALDRNMLALMYGEEGVTRQEENWAIRIAESMNAGEHLPEPDGVDLYLEQRAMGDV